MLFLTRTGMIQKQKIPIFQTRLTNKLRTMEPNRYTIDCISIPFCWYRLLGIVLRFNGRIMVLSDDVKNLRKYWEKGVRRQKYYRNPLAIMRIINK